MRWPATANSGPLRPGGYWELCEDAHGVPLLTEEADDIWKEQKKHIKCIQDLPDVPLYTVTRRALQML